VLEIANEIIAVDTGSTDGSRAVVSKAKGRIFDLEWPDSFAEAYNFGIEKVSREWTLLLDADEWLLKPSHRLVREAIKRQDVFFYTIIRQDLWNETEFTEMFAQRLWRSSPGMKMQGAIHARFSPETLKEFAQGRKLLDSSIRIRHDGFLGGISKEKVRRNLPYIDKELLANPDNLEYQIYRIESLLDLELPSAENEIKSFIERVIHPTVLRETWPKQMSLLFCRFVDLHTQKKITSELVDQVISEMNAQYPMMPGVQWSISMHFMEIKNWKGAYEALITLERMATLQEYDRFVSFHPMIFGEALWHNLSQVAHLGGDLATARRNYQKLLSLNPSHPVASVRIRELEAN